MTPTTPDLQRDLPGRIMAREMAERPTVLRRILDEGAARVQGMSGQARDGASREELEALAGVALANWPRARVEEDCAAG